MIGKYFLPVRRLSFYSLISVFFQSQYINFFKILFYLTLQYCIDFAIYQNESATEYINF